MPNYIWPLSASTVPDEMNTPFGPRINNDRWDFHDGIDLPADLGTRIFAMHSGTVFRAGSKEDDDGKYSSRHIVLKVNDPGVGTLYLVHLHLDHIETNIVQGASVNQGAYLGSVGSDGASYPHLHIEFRQGSNYEVNSVHPLGFLPYTGTSNFNPPMGDRFNQIGGLTAARLLFTGNSRLEGDLRRVEVDLLSDGAVLSNRTVDFNQKATVNEGNDDGYIYKGDIGVEGYQKSDMKGLGQHDLKYGILVRKIPVGCSALVARVIDVGGNVVTSNPIPIPNQTATDLIVDFENGQMPPSGWTVVTGGATESVGTEVSNDVAAACNGTRGMRCSAAALESAAIDYALPAGRFEWHIEGYFKATANNPLKAGESVYLLQFLGGLNFSVAARIRHDGTKLVAGIAYQTPNAQGARNNSTGIALGGWLKWRLSMLRLATREMTAVLYLDQAEHVRVSLDSTGSEPLSARAGIARSTSSAALILMVDDIRLTESTP